MASARPGLDPKWLTAWRRQSQLNDVHRAARQERTLKGLEFYAANGFCEAVGKPIPPLEVTPPWAPWERYLDSHLSAYASELQSTFEKNGVAEGGTFDGRQAAQSFAAWYTAHFVDLRRHALFPSRFSGRSLQMMSLKDVTHAALGLITGAQDEALQLARLQVRAYFRQYYFDAEFYPIFVLMLRLLADYLGEDDLEPRGESRKEASCQLLFENWRVESPGAISEICLAVADYHTQRCGLATRDHYHEFDNGAWMRMPIELLLLFRLRLMIGLKNPELDHPLVRTALGRLPPEIGFRPDALVSNIRTRMQMDGFEEGAIAALYQ